MPEFCTKCGKEAKPGVKFCSACGGQLSASGARPAPPLPRRGGGCRTGCAIGCLVVFISLLLILGLLIGGAYYLFSKLKNAEPGDYFEIDAKSKSEKVVSCSNSLSCLDQNLKKCSRAKGEAELGEFATAELEVLGFNGKSCVVFVELSDIKELPGGLGMIPDFIVEKIFKGLSMECLVPQTIYTKGIESAGDYIGDNMADICQGSLFDMAEKYGVDLKD